MKTGSLGQIRCRTLRRDSLLDDVEAVDARRAAVWANQSRKHFDCCAFPGPFGPTINVICFGSACSETPRRIALRPKLFTMLCVEIISVCQIICSLPGLHALSVARGFSKNVR